MVTQEDINTVIELIAGRLAQKVHQEVAAATTGPKMRIGDEYAAIGVPGGRFENGVHARTLK